MTVDFQSLLPTENSTPFELAVEQASGERWANLDAQVIRDYKNPDKCPEHLLPFLAAERSVDIWDEDWPVEKKRFVISQAPKHHRHKGTKWIIAEYLNLIGAKVVRIKTPPQHAWCGTPMSDEDYQLWLSRLPQVRIYYNAPTILKPLAAASLSIEKTRRTFFGKSFLVQGLPVGHRRKRAFYWDQGEETELTWNEVENRSTSGTSVLVEQITLPAENHTSPSFFGSSFFGRGFSKTNSIAERTVSITTPVDVTEPRYFATRKAVMPSDEVVSLIPEEVSIPREIPPLAAINGRAMGRVAFVRPNSWKSTYKRFYINKPERWAGIDGGRPRKFMGRCQFGMEPFTAEITVDLSETKSPRRMGRFAGAFSAPQTDKIQAVKQVLVASKAARDRIMIITKTRRTPVIGDNIIIGEHRIGDTVST